MEVVSMAAEIYASAAGTIAQIWILSELFPRKQSVKKVYIVGWILLNFCIAHFVLLPNIWQSLLGMGVMLLMSCIMLEGKTEQKMLCYHCLQCFYDSGKYVERENNLFLVRGIYQ